MSTPRNQIEVIFYSYINTFDRYFRFHVLLIWKPPCMQVWDIDAGKLCYPHLIQKAITAFSVLQKSLYM